MTSNVTPNTISGRSAFIELLLSEGVTHLFGNPGTTELPIMHALADYPDMRYVLGLQEAIVVAMADGYARASGKLVACNVHVAPGLGNAMGSLFTAFNSGTPLIIAGNEIIRSDAFAEAARFAEIMGCPVYDQTVLQGAHFPTGHPAYLGPLSRDQKTVRARLDPYDTVISLGSDFLRMSVYSE